ncbi:LysR family transcriptional regulator [Peribacillus asahii]|uniref:LysR family transcriptional regulator n=1 Tax=Peribacillus asahii TaxID=228899 RepID=UPI0020793B1D|nr:LysR family transcriptional regulator [Peribacillus asahii]USK62009.1 LysR family transcriptional regulator [Peribacillus asahii]
MTITQLQVFAKTVETGSFTKAAQALNMTQPAVSHAISSIEAELGVTLFIRDRRKGLILTDTGKRIIIHTREVLKGIEKIEQEAAAEKGLEVGTIRIGSFPSASAYFLPKIISTLKQKYPKLELLLYEGTLEEVNEWLLSRVIDIGIVILPNEGMDIIPLVKNEMFVALRDDHPLHSRASITVKDLENEPLIIFKGGYESPIIEMFNHANTELTIEFTVSNVSTSLNMIQEGLGLTILSELSLLSLPPNVQIRNLNPPVWREIGLAVPSLKESSPAVKVFIPMVQELFGGKDEENLNRLV